MQGYHTGQKQVQNISVQFSFVSAGVHDKGLQLSTQTGITEELEH